MACIKPKVFLGFEDEPITTKYSSQLNYTTNKVGGKPDWDKNESTSNPVCQKCGLVLPLIVQIYAPLEKSPYHRTLYLFGCVNPDCWNKCESWVCLRSQILDNKVAEPENCGKTSPSFDWCKGANDWEDSENDNLKEESRNKLEFISEDINLHHKMLSLEITKCNEEEMSPVDASNNILSMTASAEIESDEGDVITIDTPSVPQVDVAALFNQVKPVPQASSASLTHEFQSFFISVSEEEGKSSNTTEFEVGYAVNEESYSLMEKSQLEMEVANCEATEKYEKTLPAHGDKLFHNFISRIKRNPHQILRYIRDGGSPLFLYPTNSVPQQCQHCHSELVYELQLMPTLISRLHLVGSGTGHIEFGTVLVMTCKQSCWSPTDHFRSERVLVQCEV